MGGAMIYLSRGLKEQGFGGFGKVLAILFCILCIGGSLGGGSAFQVNQSLLALQDSVPYFVDKGWLYGLFMAILCGAVVLGGIRRIALTARYVIPFTCGVFLLAGFSVLILNFSAIPAALGKILSGAFRPDAIYGGLAGALVQGFRFAAFSNEAGMGSAALAHATAKTRHPVRQGLVSLLEPFIDTVVICAMSALVIVVTGAYDNPEYVDLIKSTNGAGLASRAFSQQIPFFKYLFSFCVVVFAYSTIITWSYYGERCWTYLFGEKSALIFKLGFIFIVYFSATISAENVLQFSDLMILGMAFPNLIGVFILSGKVRKQLDAYWASSFKA
jgi:alanine or glycine:cation symporter, AGCS family